MKVYHGSYMEIVEIDLSQCRKNKDFGQGFYVTKYEKHAEEWAERIGSKQGTAGFVTEFEFGGYFYNERDFKVLCFNDYTEDWLDFVVLNRNNRSEHQVHDYDIVEGPIANDRVARRIYDYLDGIVSKENFLDELKYHESTHQICFCTVKSLQLLENLTRKSLRCIEDITESVVIALITKDKITEIEAAELFCSSVTFAQLADKSTEFYLKSGQEVYEILKQELKQQKIYL
jgi:hypothetical protein